VSSRVLFLIPNHTPQRPASNTSPSATWFSHALDPTSCLPDVCHSCVHPPNNQQEEELKIEIQFKQTHTHTHSLSLSLTHTQGATLPPARFCVPPSCHTHSATQPACWEARSCSVSVHDSTVLGGTLPVGSLYTQEPHQFHSIDWACRHCTVQAVDPRVVRRGSQVAQPGLKGQRHRVRAIKRECEREGEDFTLFSKVRLNNNDVNVSLTTHTHTHTHTPTCKYKSTSSA
jgi:hypothetical protein